MFGLWEGCGSLFKWRLEGKLLGVEYEIGRSLECQGTKYAHKPPMLESGVGQEIDCGGGGFQRCVFFFSPLASLNDCVVWNLKWDFVIVWSACGIWGFVFLGGNRIKL